MSCNCAYYVDNWFFGYQVYCYNLTEYWINPLGYVLIFIILIIFIYYYPKIFIRR